MLGFSNEEFSNDTSGECLKSVDEEKDLGVIIHSNLVVAKQCLESINGPNKMLYIINHSAVYKSKEVTSKLYSSC